MTTLKFSSDNSDKRFGRIVAEMRQARAIAQAELARRVTLSPSHLSNIEHGRSAPPNEKLARSLARAMGLNLNDKKRFVADANVAHAQWHARRVSPRLRGEDPNADGLPVVPAYNSPGRETPVDAGLRRAASTQGGAVPAYVQQRDGAAPAVGTEISATASTPGGATFTPERVSSAHQIVRLGIDLPEIGAAYLEIDVSTEGSDCRLLMRVVPGTLLGEGGPPQ